MASSHESSPQGNRIAALRRFAVAITLLNVLGHTRPGIRTILGPAAGVGLARPMASSSCSSSAASWSERRRPLFLGGSVDLVDFLLPAHISGLAVAMLLYANDRLGPIAFAAAVAIASKYLVRVPVGRGYRHCLNPSNTGIAATLLALPLGRNRPALHVHGESDRASATGSSRWSSCSRARS